MGQYRLNFGYKSEFSHEILSSIKAIKDKAFPYPANEKSRWELPITTSSILITCS